MRKVIGASALAIELLAVAACSDAPNHIPTVDSVAGSYVLTAHSGEFLVEHMGYQRVPQSIIVLGSEGSLTVQDLPAVYAIDDLRGRGRVVSGRGSWKVDDTPEGYGVELRIAKGGTMPHAVYSATSILLKGARPPYTIEFSIGDPDMRQFITYSKKHGA